MYMNFDRDMKLHICPHCGAAFFIMKKEDPDAPRCYHEEGVIQCPGCKGDVPVEDEQMLGEDA